jgi:hypothetical protein
MGKFNTSGSSSKSWQSSLANTQESIVKSREQLFQDFYLPEFKNLYTSVSPDSSGGQARMGMTAGEINKSFNSAQKKTAQTLAQRGLLDTGAGAALSALNERARSSALASAYAEEAAKAEDKKAALLSAFGDFVPKPTAAAPVLSSQKQGSITI